MKLTTCWRTTLAIVMALSIALTVTVGAAPDSSAQGEVTVMGVIQAGDTPVEGVTLTNSITSATTDPAGEFTIEALPGLDDVALASVQTAASPEFALTGGLNFSESPLVVEIPEIVEVDFTIEGGFYRDCTEDDAITGTCPTDEFFCTVDGALAGICDEVFVEIRSDASGPEFFGQWSSVGQSQENRLRLPIFNEPGVTFSVFTIDARVEEFVWNGTDMQTLNLSGPVLQDWYPDFDIDGFGDQSAEPVTAAFSPGPEFVLDNTDCDDGDTLINPAAEEIPGNAIDENCDGADGALAPLDLRFDVVRENGEVCPADFESATEGPGEPLVIDETEEVTFCFALRNNSDTTLTDVSIESFDVGIGPTAVPNLGSGQDVVIERDGFIPPGVNDIFAFANANAGGDLIIGDADDAVVDILQPPLPNLDLRFDVVRENGGVCPADFESATEGPGEPLIIDEFEEVTFCFALLNDSDTTMSDVTVGTANVLIGPFELPDLEPGGQTVFGVDGFVGPGFIEIQGLATAITASGFVQASDSALVESIFLPMPVALSIDNYEISNSEQIIDVVVTLDPGFEVPVGALEFSVIYNPAIITPVLNADPNAGAVGAPACTGLGTCGPLQPTGRVNVIAITATGITGDLIGVVTIPFRAVGDGETPLMLVDAQVVDEFGFPFLEVVLLDGSVLVQLPPPPPPGPTCAGLPVTIDMRTGASGIGTRADDVILGTPGADIINGRGGNDVICALGGDDAIKGGAGNDLIYGGGGNDIIKGGSGNDELRGGAGQDNIRGNSGSDAIYGGTDDDRLWGDSNDDQLRGGPGNDEMRGGSGQDDLRGGSGMDAIWGGRDADWLYGNLDDDELRGGSGDDVHVGGGGFDTCIDRSGVNGFTTCESDRKTAGPA